MQVGPVDEDRHTFRFIEMHSAPIVRGSEALPGGWRMHRKISSGLIYRCLISESNGLYPTHETYIHIWNSEDSQIFAGRLLLCLLKGGATWGRPALRAIKVLGAPRARTP